jgi:polysaccharide transporter, PST family
MSITKKIKKIPFFKNNVGLQKILSNISWLFADRILRMGCGLIVGVWVARYLGVQQFGVINYATAFVAIFTPLATLGMDVIVVKQLVNDSQRQQQILGTSFWLRFISGCLTWLLTIIGIFLLRPNDPISIMTVVILGASNIVQSFDTIDLWFQSQVRSKYSVIAKNAAFVIVNVIKIYLIKTQAPLIAFVLLILLESVLGAIGLVIVYKQQGHLIKLWQWSKSLAKDLLRESFPLILSGLTIMIYMRIDQLMLGQMIGDTAVGIYSAATRISEVWYFIPMAVSSSVMPAIFKAKELSEELYYRRIGELNRGLVWLSIATAIAMTFLSQPIILMLFGNSYLESGAILSVHVWASVFVFTGVATSSWFIAENLSYLSLYAILIPIYGGIGAAVATIIAQMFASLLSNGFNPKTRKLFKIQIMSILPVKL